MSKYMLLANEIIKEYHFDQSPTVAKLPTEAQLCKQYKVSRQTVRNALTYLKNLGLIESRQGSGYQATGLSLVTKRNEIPVLLPSIHEYIYPEIWYQMKHKLSENGYEAVSYVTSDSVYEERRILESLCKNPPRSMIVEGCKSAYPNPNLDLYKALEQKGTYFIFLHNMYPNINHAICIKDDNYQGAYQLGEYLIQKGHRKIAGLFQSDCLQGVERYHGFICCLRDHNLLQADPPVCWFDASLVNQLRNQNQLRFLQSFLKEMDQDVTAFLCYNDEIAYWLIRALNRQNLSVPQDRSIVSFDNSYLCTNSQISLTSIAHKEHEITGQAVEAILQKGKGLPVSSQEIPWHLYERKSVATPSHRFDTLSE